MKRFLMPGLILLFILGFLVRLYRFNNPIADWHSWRQADTSAVSRSFAENGFNLLYPTYEDVSNIASGFDNPHGYRFAEFPIYNVAQAGLFVIFKTLTLEEWGRLVSILATLMGSFFVYLIVRKYANEPSGMLAVGFYLFLPYSIYYGRTILPDPASAATLLGGIYFFDKWIEGISNIKNQKAKIQIKKQKYPLSTLYFILALSFTAVSFLLKPYTLFFTLPMVWLAVDKFKFGILKKWQLYVFLFLSILPLAMWRVWIGQHPEGIPVSNWLFNGNGIRFRPAFFRWIFYERITKLILGFTGVIFLLDGILWLFKHKNAMFFLSFAISSLIYVCTIATGNVQHDYYQIYIIPTISIFAGLGTHQLFFTLSKVSGKNVALAFCSLILILTFYFSWQEVKGYFDVNNPGMVVAGEEAAKILPKNIKVIAALPPGQAGDTSFLYYTDRQGWPALEKGIPELVRMGASYMVIASPTKDDFNGLGKMYPVVVSSSSYLILKLTK